MATAPIMSDGIGIANLPNQVDFSDVVLTSDLIDTNPTEA